MGNNEGEKPSKPEKAPSPPREQSGVHVYPDWAAVQAYYGPGAIPPPYFNPAVTSGHAAHPYMWAPSQMMPPYGSPYAAMYPHGGIYGPTAAPVCMQVATPLSLETPAKSTGNESGPGKKCKASDGHAVSGNGKVDSTGEVGVHGQSQSTDCGTEDSCDKSDDSTAREEDNNRGHNGVADSGVCHMQTHPYPGADANHGNGIVPGIPMASAAAIRGGPLPTAEVNHSSAKANPNVVTTAALCGTRPSGIGIQDERELKREKRKQSNRESARRSRLRKQAEMEELSRKVDSLVAENMALRSEINKLVEDSEKIRSENATLMEKLKNVQGQTGKTVSDRTNEQEDLLSKVNNSSVTNGNHEQGGDDK
ncbi:hypothetical protein Cgig2_007920 [Carnegiea gigantea]|uniref:BZIP domain-containing protein n=1 Tax=Carnegiea gigantea TaxID=171969 RepID=A0A9Q1KG10_9CARY|nr:hypothetical protein Cgig2_007920 [Carnegiea gigantea]